MKIFYVKAVYDDKEISAVNRVLRHKSLNLIDGPSVKLLEKKIAKLFGKKYALMVNSGSSANLLGLSALNFKHGSEIITPTLTFSTSSLNNAVIVTPSVDYRDANEVLVFQTNLYLILLKKLFVMKKI